MRSVSIAYLCVILIATLVAWGATPRNAFAQGCSAGGNSHGGHMGHQSCPMNRGPSAGPASHQHGAAETLPMRSGSASSEPQHREAATDIIQWPTLLQEPAFASRREQIEAPYRRSRPDLSASAARDYRNIVKTVAEMKAIVEWFLAHGVDTHDYEQARDFLNRLDLEARRHLEIAPRAVPGVVEAPVASKHAAQVSLANLGQSDRPAIARQQVCPVTGAKLGSMGNPIKVLVGDRPLYLCCNSCIAKLKHSADKYMVE